MRITNPRSEKTSKFFEVDGVEALRVKIQHPRMELNSDLRRILSGIVILKFWEKEGKRIRRLKVRESERNSVINRQIRA